MLFKVLISIVFNIYFTNAAIFLWSNHELKISPLEEFSTKEFLDIVENFKNPEVFLFRNPNFLSSDFKSIIKGFYSIYSPNGNVESNNIIDLTGNAEHDLKTIQELTGDSENFIAAIIIPKYDLTRPKRQLESTEDEGDQLNKEATPTGPVIYKKLHNNNELYALLYSSKPLLFRRNDSDYSEVYLTGTDEDMIIYDKRLNINIPVNGRGKITLRFSINWHNGYWYMPSVKIEDTQSNRDYNLITTEDISAQEHFSYHCNGQTVFKDTTGAELYLYDIQVQVDSRNGKFGDVNDCVPFITVPIWSGIFITFILGIGMVIALMAIMDIKTMDKFDNYKTKNLAITVSE